MVDSDQVWSASLGVDVDTADTLLHDKSEVGSWLERFSVGFLSYMISGQADPLISPKEKKQNLVNRLIARHLSAFPPGPRNVIRRLYYSHLFFSGKRQSALQLADEIVFDDYDFTVKQTSLNDREVRLILALQLTLTEPLRLMPYLLLDRSERVGFQSAFLRDNDRMDLRGHMSITESLQSMRDDQIKKVFTRFYGLPDAARLVGRVNLTGKRLPSGKRSDDTYIVFLIRRGQSESVQTYDGLFHFIKGEWIVLKYINGGTELAVHGGGREGFRLGEAIVNAATNRLYIYEDPV